MSSSYTELDEQLEKLRKGDTLAENEVKALCEKVRLIPGDWRRRFNFGLIEGGQEMPMMSYSKSHSELMLGYKDIVLFHEFGC
jgi:hypothetical protein